MVMTRRSACGCGGVGALQGKAWSALATWAPPAAGTGRCDRGEEEGEGEGSQCTTCPTGGRRELPECQSGFSPKTPATPAALDQFGTQAGQREGYKVRGEGGQRRRRSVRIEVRVIPCEEKGASVSRRVTQVVLRPVARPTAAQLSSY